MSKEQKNSIAFYVNEINSGTIKIPKDLKNQMSSSTRRYKIIITGEFEELSGKEKNLVEKIMKVQGLEKEVVVNFLNAEGKFNQ